MALVTSRKFGAVSVIEMNRPDRRNAMNAELLSELTTALDEARQSGDVEGVVIMGAGSAFSAGADVSESLSDSEALRRARLFNRLYEMVSAYQKPTVAAVQGACIGGGAEVACACDLRVATPSAFFRFPGAQFGIPVGAARLPLLVGGSHARDLLLTARNVAAEEAASMGLVNRLVASSELEHEAVALAAAMVSNPGARQSKRLLDEALDLTGRVRRESRALERWQKAQRAEKAPET